MTTKGEIQWKKCSSSISLQKESQYRMLNNGKIDDESKVTLWL